MCSYVFCYHVHTGTYDMPDGMPHSEVGYIVLVTSDSNNRNAIRLLGIDNIVKLGCNESERLSNAVVVQ